MQRAKCQQLMMKTRVFAYRPPLFFCLDRSTPNCLFFSNQPQATFVPQEIRTHVVFMQHHLSRSGTNTFGCSSCLPNKPRGVALRLPCARHRNNQTGTLRCDGCVADGGAGAAGRARAACWRVDPVRLQITIGISCVACFAAKAHGVKRATMASTLSPTSSAANCGSRPSCSSADRSSME
jgi:hypothetical protein